MGALARETPIVMLGDDWGRHVSTLQHLFIHIVPHRPVVWVNSFGHRRPRLTLYDLRRAATKLRAMMAARSPAPDTGAPRPAAIIEPKALPWHNLTAVRTFNTWSLDRDIRRALAAVAPGRPPVLVTGTPVAAGLVGRLDELAAVYFCMDDYSELPGVDRDLIIPLERTLLERVDATIATAASLARTRRPVRGFATQLPQGVHYDRFATPREVPGDMAALPRPRIGFAGGISAACDWTLIAAVADAWPEGSVALVGPLHPGVRVPERRNIHLLGNKPYDRLPAYVQAFDVGIVPYVLNDWTRAVDPLKLLEYLAAGIPVVATDIPEVHKYAAAIEIASEPAAFVAAVARSLSGDGAEARARRQALAAGHTWAHRAERLLEMLQEAVAARTRGSSGLG